MTLLDALIICKDKYDIDWDFKGNTVKIKRIGNKYYTDKNRKDARVLLIELAKKEIGE